MAADADLWIPLVDEPIGSIVERVQQEHPEIMELVATPRKLLAFRTFAYIRVGILLGRLLVEHDVESVESSTWAEQLANDPQHRAAVVAEVRTVAKEVAADPAYASDSLGPSDEERARFEEFAKRRLAADA
ncbi:MAG: hypothetical protein ACJ75Q_08770 [Gaiellaceae bacterium]